MTGFWAMKLSVEVKVERMRGLARVGGGFNGCMDIGREICVKVQRGLRPT